MSATQIRVESPEHPALSKLDARIAGACATAIVLALMWIVSSMFPGVVFVPLALAGLLVRLTPGDLATFFIETFGHWAMRMTSAGAVLGVVAAGGEGLWRSRDDDGLRPLLAGALMAAVGAVLAVGLGSGTANIPATVVVLALAVPIYAGVARSLYRSLVADAEPSRRRALRLGVGSALGASLAGGALGWLIRRLEGPDRNVTLVSPGTKASVPARDPWPDIEGLTAEITAPEDHYVVDIDFIKPSVDAEDWALEVTGEVEREVSFSFEELQRGFDIVEEYSVLTCVSNEVGGNLVGHSAWGGVRLVDVLAAAGVKDGAVDVILRSEDGYSDSITLEMARDPHVLLAVSQNGAALTQEHGFPCRVRVPFIYGMKNVKWLTSIEVVGADYEGYWQQRGWSDEAVIKTESRIDVAGDGGSATIGDATWIAGIAWAGDRGISKVEVSTDGGKTWSEAMLKEAISELSWRLWAYRWTPASSGMTTVVCRATDGDGEVQTERLAEPHPDGASGYPTTEVAVS